MATTETTDQDEGKIVGDPLSMEQLGLTTDNEGQLIAVLGLEGGYITVIPADALAQMIERIATVVEQDEAVEQGLPDEVVVAIGEAAKSTVN